MGRYEQLLRAMVERAPRDGGKPTFGTPQATAGNLGPMPRLVYELTRLLDPQLPDSAYLVGGSGVLYVEEV